MWAIAGDGGFQMTQCELATLQQEKLDIKIAVINNGYLGMVRQWQEFFYDKRYGLHPHAEPRLREAGRGLRHRRGPGQKREDVISTVEAARRSGVATLIEFQVEKKTPSIRWCRRAAICTT